MTDVVITGASGYLGGRFVPALAALPETRVAALSRKRPPWPTAAPMVFANLSRPSRALEEALVGTDVVVHLAGANEVATGRDPDVAESETLAAAHTVVASAIEAGVRRLVYVSTVHVYGAALAPGRSISEAVETQPVSRYAASRLEVERILGSVSNGPEVVIFRLSNTVGAPIDPAVDRWTLVANDLCRQAVTGGTIRLMTPGTQWRDFVPMVDVATIVGQSVNGALPAGTYNLASGQPTSVLGLAHLVQQACSRVGIDPVPLHAPEPTEPPTEPYRVDVAKLTAAGGAAVTSLVAAIEETLRFCVRHRRQLATGG